MFKRAQPILLFTLVFTIVALLGYVQVWAECDSLTPSLTTTVIEDNIKVVSGCDGRPVAVYFWDDSCTPSATDDCWRLATPKKGVLCTCIGVDCSDDLNWNLQNPGPTVNVQCYEIKQGSAGSQGCAVYSNPRTYIYGGDTYSR